MTAARCYRCTVVLLLVLFAPALIACGQLGQQPQLRVVATLAPFADWARQVGGERVSVTQLVPTGVDPRTWEPSATDLQHLSEADVVLFNGLGLEPWLNSAIERSGLTDFVALEIGQVPEFGASAVPRPRIRSRVPLPDQDTLTPGIPSSVQVPVAASPFVWLDPGPTSAQRAIALIAATFARVDINHLQLYHRNAEAYNGKLENLDTWIRRQVRDWPRIAAGKEEVVAMQSVDNIWDRFADRYDIELRLATKLAAYSPPLPASTPLFRDRLSAPPAASSSATRPPDGVLHALGDSDYERMMRSNVAAIARGMQAVAASPDTGE